MQYGHFYTGTSNIVLPGNKASFPPEYQDKSRLHYYARLFNSGEINSSFYKLPLRSTFEKWSADVPEDFRFTVKLSKTVTHAKQLECEFNDIDAFIKAAAGLGEKKGCLLVQFPGSISLDHFEKVEQILERLQQQDPNNEWRKAFEFRNTSWYCGETYELLNEFDASLVLHDIPKARMMEVMTKANFIYLRFHGPTGNYRDSYSDAFLQEKAVQIKAWLQKGKDVFAYFNNTIGDAFNNSRMLKKLIEG